LCPVTKSPGKHEIFSVDSHIKTDSLEVSYGSFIACGGDTANLQNTDFFLTSMYHIKGTRALKVSNPTYVQESALVHFSV